jgi:HEAT repeat protein
MRSPLDLIAEGPPFQVRGTTEAAALVLAHPETIDALFDGLADDNEGIRNRASGALEKVAMARPDLLAPYKRELLTRVARIDHWVVRSRFCKILALVPNLTIAERRRAVALAKGWIDDPSTVVKVTALDCLVQLSLAPGFEGERTFATARVEAWAERGDTPAERARARILRKQLAKLARAARA